ncbi:MAG: hypothetical protein HY316_11020 [Acidobacteria bacterium]|nr:hypothetical protein [Acidobacteriota bacterium]
MLPLRNRTATINAGLMFAAILVLGVGPARGQGVAVGPYTFTGSVGLGYRFLDLNGNSGKYNQLLNLQEGFRVFDTQLDFLSSEVGQGWLDRFTITSQNLGGDPYPAIAVQLRKHGLYELRVGYRATQYFLDLPQTSFTPNRGWLDRRRFSDLELRYTPSRDLRLRIFYNRTQRDGSDRATSPFFYIPVGPSLWGAFGRANSLPWVIPLREKADLIGFSADYRLVNTNFHLEQSWRRYDNPANLGGFASLPLELLGLASPAQNIRVQQWAATSHLEIPTTSFHLDTAVIPRLQLRGGYVYTHASGPADLDGTILSPLGASLPPVVLNVSGRGDTRLTSHTGEVGFTFSVFDRLDFLSDYRYQSYRQAGNQFLQALRADFPSAVRISDENMRWDQGLHTLDSQFAFVPLQSLRVQAGLRFLKQDVTRKLNGAVALGTQRTWSYSPVVRVSWKPSARLSIRGNLETRTVVDPYTRITPEDTVGSSIRVQYSFSNEWRVDNIWSFRNLETEDLGLLVHTRRNSTTLSYSPESLVGFYGGFNYDSFSSENSIIYRQGQPPLTGLLSSDQTIDRTYFWGLKVNPVERLLLDLSGQFARSTGLGTFTGESSNYGPLTWTSWNSQISYDFPQIGRLGFGWQRSYYLENLRRAADYSANSFTLRIDRRF